MKLSTEQEYEQALERIEQLMTIGKGRDDGQELEELTEAVEEYEFYLMVFSMDLENIGYSPYQFELDDEQEEVIAQNGRLK